MEQLDPSKSSQVVVPHPHLLHAKISSIRMAGHSKLQVFLFLFFFFFLGFVPFMSLRPPILHSFIYVIFVGFFFFSFFCHLKGKIIAYGLDEGWFWGFLKCLQSLQLVLLSSFFFVLMLYALQFRVLALALCLYLHLELQGRFRNK